MSPYEHRILCTVANYTDKGGAVYPDVLDPAMKRLERMGLLERHHAGSSGKKLAMITEAGRKAIT